MIHEATYKDIRCKDCKYFRRYSAGYYTCIKDGRGRRIEKYYTCENAERPKEKGGE